MDALLYVIDMVLSLYLWVIIIGAILSWLIAFDVVNRHNRVVWTVSDFCHRLTEPAVAKLRRIVPAVNGIDLAPLALIVVIIFVRRLLLEI